MRREVTLERIGDLGRLLPSQWFQRTGSPERDLLVAILARALLDWENERTQERGIGDATRWFESSRPDRYFSFYYVCHHLGLDPLAIRKALRQRRATWAVKGPPASGGCSGEGNEFSRWKNLLRTG